MEITVSRLKAAGFSGSQCVYKNGVVQVFQDFRGWFLGHEHPLNVAVHSTETLSTLETAINQAHKESNGMTSSDF